MIMKAKMWLVRLWNQGNRDYDVIGKGMKSW